MTTDTEVRPLTAYQAEQAAQCGQTCLDDEDIDALQAIADYRHRVINTATHEAVGKAELERLRRAIESAYREGHKDGRTGASSLDEQTDWENSEAIDAAQQEEKS